jgi:hypothetical protein
LPEKLNMKIRKSESGNSLIGAIITIALLAGIVGIAVDYTGNVGRNAQRNRTIAKAVEIGDGSLELAFASWRKICANQTTPTDPLSSTSFTALPTPSPGNFPLLPSLSVTTTAATTPPANSITNFQVQPVDPLLSPLPSGTLPSKSTGPGTGTFSYFYLASADVTVPAIKGTITAKVRRVFEQRVTSPWNWAIMFNDNLELSPSSNLTLNGWVHTNGSLYTASDKLTVTDRLSYVSDWNIAWAPGDTFHTTSAATAPTTPSDYPPGHEQAYVPFGWDPQTLINTTDTNTNNDSYRELIERPASGTDPWSTTRYYNQAALVINVGPNPSSPGNDMITSIIFQGVTYTSQPNGNGTDRRAAWDAAQATVSPNHVIQDNREGSVRVTDFDMTQFMNTYTSSTTKGWNGIVYISDTSGSASNKRAIRLKNAAKVPSGGVTFASENPVYIQGDFNSGRTGSTEPPSNTGDPTDSTVSGYTSRPSLIAADAVTLMSNAWNDSNASQNLVGPGSGSPRTASNTTVNAAIIAGIVPTNADGLGSYSGGAENFVRMMEDWTNKTFTYYGSMIELFKSAQATERWGKDNTYYPAALKWYFDSSLTTSSPPSTQSSNMTTVSYLQQQRWFITFATNG